MQIKNKFVMLLGSIFLFTLFSCRDEESLVKGNPIKVETVSVRKEKLENNLKNLGSLSYKSKHSISSLVSGRLVNINVKEGDYVTNGQVLGILRNIQLENQKDMYENNLSEAESSLMIAEDNLRTERLNIEKQMKNLEKLKLQIQQTEREYDHKEKCFCNSIEIFAVGGLSELKLKEEELNLFQLKTSLDLMKKEYEINSIGFRNEDIENFGYEVPESEKEKNDLLLNLNTRQATNAVSQERSRVDSVRKNLMSMETLMEELNVRSTVAGIVATCNFQLGDHVSENETSFVIFDASKLDAVFYVQEQEIEKYSIDNRINILIPSVEASFETAVSEISPVADPVTGNFCVKAEINNRNNELKPGMFVSCNLSMVDPIECLVIPETCLVYGNSENPMVICVSNGHVFYKKIKIQCKKNGMVYVEKGLDEKDLIVDRPSVMLKEGESVDIH